MKISSYAVAIVAMSGATSAFQPSPVLLANRVLPSRSTMTTTTTTALFSTTESDAPAAAAAADADAASSSSNRSNNNSKVTKKEERLRMMKKPNFYRAGFKEVREEVEKEMNVQFKGAIVDELKSSNYVIERDGVKVHLAKDFGFCWGVERSIALAYEAVNHFPGKKVHITNELIHNPEVHESLTKMNVNLIEKLGSASDGNNNKNFDVVQDGDVVILPAFGASFEEMDLLDKKNVQVVDTTCPWVSKVWNTVDKHQKGGATSVIHGKYAHEETVATTSFAENYICVKDMKEAQMVADYIINGGDKQAFMEYFKYAVSEGFDPDTMLTNIGLANQTTMYKKETRAIGQLLQKAMMKKYGPVEASKHYMEFDTICDATQERQDAITELTQNAEALGLDFILVIGGFDSSNTAHLLEIPQHVGLKSFHIDRADRITADNKITHRKMNGEIVTETFLDNLDKDVVMGVTSGASTPDKAVQDSLSNIFMLKKLHNSIQN